MDLPVYNPAARTATPKPSKLRREVAKHGRVVARRKAQRREDVAEAKRHQAIRDQVWVRDRRRCRAYGVTLKRVTDVPTLLGHVHHIRFRSAQGPTTLKNLVLLSPVAHERAHSRYDGIVLDIAGDPNGTLTLTERNRETGKVLKQWTSPCPTGRTP